MRHCERREAIQKLFARINGLLRRLCLLAMTVGGWMPDFELENLYDGPVFGLDEVGRGPLAGPVVAACVCVPKEAYTLPFASEIRDSKTLSRVKLEKLYTLITQHFMWSVAEVSPQEIDRINILQASLRAMEAAFDEMAKDPRFRGDANKKCFALVDGNKMPKLSCSAQCVVKGDSKSVSIAAASIVAKVTRDRLMKKLHEDFPDYGWNRNAGYPTQAHLDAIDAFGITPHHRKSYAPVKKFLNAGSTRDPLKSAG